MPQPTSSMVHVDTPLTNISVAFMQRVQNFVAGRVFPNIPVSKQSDLYYVYDRGFFNRNEVKRRAPNTESAGVGYETSTNSYFAHVYAVHHDIPDQIRSTADSQFNLDRDAAELVTQQLLLNREQTWMDTYFTTGVWSTDITGVASSPTGSQTIQWSDGVNSDPISDVRAGKTAVLEATGFEPNILVMGQRVYDALVDHPDIIDRVKYSGGVGNGNPARVNATSLAALFEVSEIIVSKAIKNTAAEGATNSHSFVAGKNALLAYRPSSPGLLTPSAGYTFSWNGYLGTTNQFGIAVSKFRLPTKKSDRVEGEMAYDQKLISADLGYFFSGIVA